MEAASKSLSLPSPSASAGGNLSSNALNAESQRLGTLQEALTRKRSTLNAPKTGAQTFSGGFQDAMLQGFQGGLTTGQDESGAIAQEGDEMIGQAAQMAREEGFRARLQSLTNTAKDKFLESEAGQKAKEQIQKEVRKAVWSAVRRGIEYLYDFLIGPSVDGGSMGISLVVDVVGYALTLVDLNMQMIWGYYITKKKSILFPALEWSPLKIPLLPDLMLHAGVIMLDLVVVLVFTTLALVTLVMILLPAVAPLVGISLAYALYTDPAFRASVFDMAAAAVAAATGSGK